MKRNVIKSGLVQRSAIVLAFLATVATISAGVWRHGYLQALGQVAQQGRAALDLNSDRLVGQVQRARELAVLMADHPMMPALAAGRQGDRAAQLFLEVADKTAALDVMFVNRAGRVQAAARAAAGADLGDQDYIRRAMQGALGWGHGVDRPLAPRAFYAAAPAFDAAGRVQGAVVVAVDMTSIEDSWRGSNPAVFFTDERGAVFVSNRSELVFWERPENGPGLVPPEGAAPAFDSYRTGPHEVWQLGWGPYLPQNALHLTRALPVIGLTGEVLIDVAPARALATSQAAAVAALCLAFGALLFLATERRRTLAAANAQLEARVAERTAALSDTNAQLRREATEREEAQTALARAQADLVQAGKLSALGQMSAGISHELNQPLMAIRSFAENAVQYLDRDQPDRAAENLGRISDMARRMGRIIKNLRAFARNDHEPQTRVDAAAVLRSALDLTASRIDRADVTVAYDPPPGPVWVRGGDVRLGQVFVNLIANAADAMEGRATRTLRITIEDGARPAIHFADTGPGIDMPDKMFEPFYSTKSVGSGDGMGLGLSISYGIVQSFGGEIKGSNTGEGALFTVRLDPMPAKPGEVRAA
ncbi:sensor histidine kinase [Sulfitobacter sabulilitoris]|uniref:C4-dicarboxylate transport sensor protein DctB n=1 Tax=Sulfitobacter sabulilitoris TaxID=2562655 RepID=A0A5S3PJ12_9RHOB|nr:ATP-binding protein [Sulfitobacter sabulilitoris]TMM54373.1 sensor histidine kinase [Sulfitobacter sabulilitoris]